MDVEVWGSPVATEALHPTISGSLPDFFLSMAAPYKTNQQAYPPASHPPEGQAATSTQPKQVENVPELYPALPPQDDLPPSYNTSSTPSVIVVHQPTTATTTDASSPAEASDNLAICALVLSAFTMICCGAYLLFLICIIPAFILALKARESTGSEQQTNGTISIGLNVAVVACCVLFLVISISTPFIMRAHQDAVSQAALESARINMYKG